MTRRARRKTDRTAITSVEKLKNVSVATNQTSGGVPTRPRNYVNIHELKDLARSGYAPRAGEPVSTDFIDNARGLLVKAIAKLSRKQLRNALQSVVVESAYEAYYLRIENERRDELHGKFTELQAAVKILGKINSAL